jgi:hypothetical protein
MNNVYAQRKRVILPNRGGTDMFNMMLLQQYQFYGMSTEGHPAEMTRSSVTPPRNRHCEVLAAVSENPSTYSAPIILSACPPSLSLLGQVSVNQLSSSVTMSRNPMFVTGDYSRGTQHAVAQRGTPATLNLDDIFGDVVFTPDGETIFLSEEQEALASGERELTTMASKVQNGQYVPVAKGGGLYTTALYDASKAATTMGAATYSTPGTAPVPFKKAPQERHHLQYALPKGKSKRGSTRGMSDSQKVERRYVRRC